MENINIQLTKEQCQYFITMFYNIPVSELSELADDHMDSSDVNNGMHVIDYIYNTICLKTDLGE